MVKCTNCGTRNRGEAVFCGKCGQPMHSGQGPQAAAQQASSWYASVPAPAQGRASRQAVVVPIVIAALITALIGTLLFTFAFSGSSDTSSPETPATTGQLTAVNANTDKSPDLGPQYLA